MAPPTMSATFRNPPTPVAATLRDRARVLHSSALRRLARQDPGHHGRSGRLPTNTSAHTLEVAQISRELGASLGAEPDIVDTAGLAHDLRHPPFGHNGEDVLAGLSEDIGGFGATRRTCGC